MRTLYCGIGNTIINIKHKDVDNVIHYYNHRQLSKSRME